jgi:hypothetical protein
MNNEHLRFQQLEQRITMIEETLHGEQTVTGELGLVDLIRDIRSVLYGNAENPGGIISTIVQVRKTMLMLAGIIVSLQVLLGLIPVVLLILKLRFGI